MTSAAPGPARSRTRTSLAITAVVLAIIVVLFFVFASLYTDALWFDQLGFLNVLTTQWGATAVMFAVGLLGMAVPVLVSIEVAFRTRPMYAKLNSQLDRYQQVIEPLRRLAMWGIPVVLGVFMGVSTATRWPTVLQWLQRTPFGQTDPQFGLDASFYVYELPFWHGLVGYASAVVIVSGLAVLATDYLYGGIRVSGREVRITRAARVQIGITAAVYLLLQGVSIWLDQYLTVTDSGGASDLITGATYTDVNAVIPGRLIIAGAAVLVAVLCVVTASIGRWRLPLIGVGVLVVASLVVGTVFPAVIQRFQVLPSERTLESPYIERNIEATRSAFGVDQTEVQQYDAVTDAEPGALRADAETTANIRIIDPAQVSQTFAQLEQVRQYYQFQDHLDVDRYTIDGQIQDTVIAVRELNQANQSSGGWVNDTLVYTHGYGVVAAYGNRRTSDGQPEFLESGIPSTGELGDFEPRIYFGEDSPSYSIVGAKNADGEDVELDYPSSEDDSDAAAATTTFDGDGGPKLDNFFKRLVYAIKFQSEQIVLSDDVSDESQILYGRDPSTRVRQAAPYLTPDSDPYPAVVDGRVVWIIDAYTTSAGYPYSQTQTLSSAIADTNTPRTDFPTGDVNYIRNSVKATVDAYSGEVTLYQWDEDDPVLKTWAKVFPGSLTPRSEMSEDLLAHIRYPADLFKMQRQVLEAYHVTNTSTFYSGDDRWSTPPDPTSDSANPTTQPPYYLTMQTPGSGAPAFTLYSTYIPQAASSSRSVLTGYLTVNSDAGEDYGKLTLLTLPKDDTVPGPGQVQNTFTSDTQVGEQLNILGRGDSRVIRGNLLTVPVGGGLLYVQPVYVAANANTSYPLLRRVLVSFGSQVAFEDTLNEALDVVFGGDSGAETPDGEVGGTPDPDPTTDPTDPTTPPTDGGDADNAALQAALADYQEALADRTAAYAANDLAAAAEADSRMQDAVERAIDAVG